MPNPYLKNADIVINTNILLIIENTVVLYFLLLLFKFLYAITPPIPNNLFINLGAFNLFAFIFTSLLPLIDSIGLIFEALIAEEIAEKYIVINPSKTDTTTGIQEIFKTNSPL